MKKQRVTTSTADDAPEAMEYRGFDAFANGMALMGVAASCLNSVAAVNGELVGFVADRWRRDVDLGQSMACCENWNAAVALQQDWAKHTVQDYLAEASKLMQIASTTYLASHSTGPGEKQRESDPKAL